MHRIIRRFHEFEPLDGVVIQPGRSVLPNDTLHHTTLILEPRNPVTAQRWKQIAARLKTHLRPGFEVSNPKPEDWATDKLSTVRIREVTTDRDLFLSRSRLTGKISLDDPNNQLRKKQEEELEQTLRKTLYGNQRLPRRRRKR